MLVELGEVEAIFRYPVKSMSGERLVSAQMGWHGLDGDRRFALRRVSDQGDFPWLTATQLPDLVLFAPQSTGEKPPAHVREPGGKDMAIFGAELAGEIARRYGAPVEMIHYRNGIFDDAAISVIASGTIREIGRLAGRTLDVRRFRPNIVVNCAQPDAFQEDAWVGGSLLFGDASDAPSITVTMRDLRCAMVNLDPDTAKPAPEVMKAIVRANANYAGIYGAVTRTGCVSVGQKVWLRAADKASRASAAGAPQSITGVSPSIE